ncbi:hypothetical protein FM106_30500 [Brachybacterium faecium]|nr:hypothetical protein FM106_30500 [Brachybacterium faecium]
MFIQRHKDHALAGRAVDGVTARGLSPSSARAASSHRPGPPTALVPGA